MLPLTVFLVLGVLAQQTFADEPEAIVGGQRAAPGEFPWQCSLNVNGQHICGCSIIGPNKILTAAHCLDGIVRPPYSNLRVLTGNININQGSSHGVRSARIHPNYIPTASASWVNDIAVITLQGSIQYNQYQSPIPLCNSAPVPGTRCTLSGWGLTSANGRASSVLLKMDQALVSTDVCQRRIGARLTQSHLCAFNQRGIGACQGDSGGPLVCNGMQYGITSFVLPCALGEPDAYTSVYHHLNFINSSSMLPLTVFLVLGVLAQQTFADEPEAIVGGQRAAPGEFPWQCSLVVNNQHSCGCSIIGPNKILTAAHCLEGIVRPPYSNLRVLTGNININQGSSHVVKNVRLHPNYIPDVWAAWVNDIAVITLQGAIQYNQYQTAVPLANTPPVPGTRCTLSGWGLTSVRGRPSPVLLKMDQAVVSNQACQESHGLKLTESHMCAFNRRGIGACSGDSGGPLVCNGKQYGITSFARPCAVGLSDVYTSVYHHLQFINSS
ncbi:hypothetical protein DMN91_001286 [Ooceraea biroi]|uniref:Peptidase S1 domain-containing protein n=3 Tax=Ooceraea biroi TaxID=2015173 RepID=A0A3L8E4L1_OOCBI|nr:hypothetical protein DMN91_001286 [Ooceraea biroi]